MRAVILLLLFVCDVTCGMLVNSSLSTFNNAGKMFVRSCSCLSGDPKFRFSESLDWGNQFSRTINGSRLVWPGIWLVLGSTYRYWHNTEQENERYNDMFVKCFGVGVAMIMYSNFHKPKRDESKDYSAIK